MFFFLLVQIINFLLQSLPFSVHSTTHKIITLSSTAGVSFKSAAFWPRAPRTCCTVTFTVNGSAAEQEVLLWFRQKGERKQPRSHQTFEKDVVFFYGKPVSGNRPGPVCDHTLIWIIICSRFNTRSGRASGDVVGQWLWTQSEGLMGSRWE